MLRIGLTGGIACGKSTVAQLLEQRGIPVRDADQVAREVVAPGTDGLAAIVDRFGPGVLAEDGGLDRPALRQRVIASPEARRALEAITHPRIHAALEAWLAAQAQAGAAAAVVDAALMIETGSAARYDALLVVACRPETQLARLMARDGHDEAVARRWLSAQLPIDEKVDRALAHGRAACIRNDDPPAALPAAVDAALARIGAA